jgi:alkylation response protein AidB-like acyl-CoA dehydrogenase
VRSFTATEELIRGDGGESLYGYPIAFLTAIPAETRGHDIALAEVERLWRVAVAAEIAGLLAAALQSVVTYTSDRKQFGRPIATFQALRHRMAEDQVVTNAAYWLAMKAAAGTSAADAAMALNYGQEAAKRVVYDYHQFLGGMGMTLEHPLHLWTYRLRLLTAELGGRGANALAAAEAIWG